MERLDICSLNELNRKDLTGNKYGHLTVVEMLYGYNGGRRTFCRCVCDCGNEKIICAEKFSDRHSSIGHLSCGCMTKYYRAKYNRHDRAGEIHNGVKILSVDYSHSPAIAECECRCGNIFHAIQSAIVSGKTQSCGCLQRQRASEANQKDFSGYISDSGVKIVSRSTKTERGVWLWNCLCPICGETFVALPAKIQSNHTTSCGCKIKSAPERIIKSTLDNLGVHYEVQKRFADCKSKYTLPFDFCIYNSNGSVSLLIEYDGYQHFAPIDFYGGEIAYQKRKQNDSIKDEYCSSHGIRLIRIDYRSSPSEIKEIITNIIYPERLSCAV